MMESHEKAKLSAELKLPVLKGLMPLAQSFAESSATAFGLDSKSALSLALAAEEIFLYLCKSLEEGSTLDLHSDGRGGHAILEFRFIGGPGFSLRAFNITAKTPSELSDDDSLAEAGLILASRSVDSFSLHEDAGGLMRLRLVKDRSYPPASLPAVEIPAACGSWTIRPPKGEELPLLSALLEAVSCVAPEFLSIPAKTADMLAAGTLSLLLAVRPDGFPCGAVAWARREPGRALECFGPYPLFASCDGAKAMARDLLDAFIAAICKYDAPLVFALGVPPELASTHFERLPGGEGKAFFRLLEEDEGSTLWLSPGIEGYVRDACASLYLPRIFVQAAQMPCNADSVFFSDLSRKNSTALLRPVRYGLDVKANIAAHLETLRAEGFKRIRCELDLATPWHCLLAEPLSEAGFAPGVYLPLAGEGDLLLMDFKG